MSTLHGRVFGVKEQIRNIYYGAKSFVLLKSSKKLKLMNPKFKERIMLGVTEVNGCAMCSFMHTRFALSSGMSREDIKEILDGNTSNVPVEEAVAVMFAQDFAYSKEEPNDDSIKRLKAEYGFNKAELVLAACNVITMTNGMGTSMDYLYNRIKFKRNKESNLFLEIMNPLLTMILFPVLVLFFGFKTLFGFRPRKLNPRFN